MLSVERVFRLVVTSQGLFESSSLFTLESGIEEAVFVSAVKSVPLSCKHKIRKTTSIRTLYAVSLMLFDATLIGFFYESVIKQ